MPNAANNSKFGLPSLSTNNPATFKSGSQLPSIADYPKTATSALDNKYADINKQFEDMGLDDNDFGDDFGDEDEEEEEQENEEDEGDFDANELLNFSDYQNKRK